MRRIILGCLASMVLAGCVSASRLVPIDEYRDVAFDHDAAVVKDVFRQSFADHGLTILRDSAGVIHASAERARDRTRFRVRFQQADTLQTLARISATYLPYRATSPQRFAALLDRVEELLESDAFRYPLVAYPAGRRECESPDHDEGANLVLPILHGGLRSLQDRLVYPYEARAAGIEGEVFVMFTVNEEGRIDCAMITRGLPGGLNEAAMRAVLQATFDPGSIDGEPVPIRLALPIRFRLR